ncbi:MAG: hypothetical protein U1E86_21410 [Burkholderiaceae bacterium]
MPVGFAVHAAFVHAAPGAGALNSEQVDPFAPFVRTVPVTMRARMPSMDIDTRVIYAQPYALPAAAASGAGLGLPGSSRAPRTGGPAGDAALAVGGLSLPASSLYVREVSANATWLMPSFLPFGLNADLIQGVRLRSPDRSIEGPGPGRIVNVEFAVWRRFGRWTMDAGAGYRWRTADDGYESRRGRYAFAGGVLRVREATRVEIYVDERADGLAGDPPLRQLSVALTHTPDRLTRIQGFYTRDLDLLERPPEIGISVSRRF